MKVLNYGSMNYDYVYQVNHVIKAGETLNTLSMETHLGGKGFNQSVALAKAGLPVYHAGSLGEEGDTFLKAFEKYGVNTDHVSLKKGKSGHTIIQVDRQGENCILLFGGANRSQTEEQINAVLADFGEGDYLILQNEVNLLDQIIDKAYEKKMIIVLNPSPYDQGLDNCDLSKVALFMLNEIEGEMMTGSAEPACILDWFRKHYQKAALVLTLGTAGAWYQDAEERVFQKAFPAKAVDTTAAGDTFTGYFIAARAEGKSAAEALELAAKASAITVTRQGAGESIPWRKEVC